MAAEAAAGRMPFVGRETQLGALLSAVAAAELGERVLALVAGEPGIGKTRLVTEVAGRSSARALWATCWEGDAAPAYWPWLQLARELSDDAAGLLRAAPAGPDVDARFQLFDAVAEGFAAASREQPLLLVLDDLHWADEASIRLLEFVARDTRPRRLAVVGTYRDTDLDASRPLADRLANLVRDGLHVTLGGLGPRDVATLAGAARPEAVARLHRQSGGNPFFLLELLRAADDAPSGGVRAVVAHRLAPLSGPGRAVLDAACVVGAEFDVATLGPVTGRSGDDLLAALHEAQAVGLVQPGFRFVHALVREVLYAELSPPARAALHRAVATALEDRHGDARPAELAHHVLAGGVEPADGRGVDYAVRAAEHGLAVHAYEEAAHWYDRALGVLRPGDAREGALLLGLGGARLAGGDVAGARDAYQRAADLARRAGDAEQLAQAALGLGAGLGGFEVQLLDPLQVELLEDALDALGPRPSALRAWVLARLSVALAFIDAEARRRELAATAVTVAREVGDPSVIGYALAAHCDTIPGPDDCERRLADAAEIVRLGRDTGDRRLELLGRRLRVVALLETGDLADADTEIDRFALVAERVRQPLYRWYVPLWRGMRALMRGQLDAAASFCAQAEELGTRAGSHNAMVLTFTQWWVRERYAGRTVEAGTAMGELLDRFAAAPQVTAGQRAVIAALRGDLERAGVLLGQWLAAGLAERARDSEWLPESAQLAQVAVAAGAREPAGKLYAQLRPYAGRFCVEGIGAAVTGSASWYLAELARLLGRTAEADAHEQRARAAHARIGLVGDPPPITPGAAAPAADAEAELVWEGATWAVRYAGRAARLRDSKGLRDLAVLLSRPQQEVHCLELVGGADVGGEAGPAIDQTARRAYEQRIRDLQEDIDEARDMGDPARAERAEDELDALVQHLAGAFGLSGRSRGTGSAAERARSAVSWRIRATLRHVAEVHPELARHLRNAVRTGTWCAYRPETAVRWKLGQGRSA